VFFSTYHNTDSQTRKGTVFHQSKQVVLFWTIPSIAGHLQLNPSYLKIHGVSESFS
jgi:hypothetical protein